MPPMMITSKKLVALVAKEARGESVYSAVSVPEKKCREAFRPKCVGEEMKDRGISIVLLCGSSRVKCSKEN